MDPSRFDTLLRWWVVVTLIAGNALILFGASLLTSVGVVLVILSLVSLIAVVRNALTPASAT